MHHQLVGLGTQGVYCFNFTWQPATNCVNGEAVSLAMHTQMACRTVNSGKSLHMGTGPDWVSKGTDGSTRTAGLHWRGRGCCCAQQAWNGSSWGEAIAHLWVLLSHLNLHPHSWHLDWTVCGWHQRLQWILWACQAVSKWDGVCGHNWCAPGWHMICRSWHSVEFQYCCATSTVCKIYLKR